MTTKELQEKMEHTVHKYESTTFVYVNLAEDVTKIAQQAITEAVAEAVAEKEKKIQEFVSGMGYMLYSARKSQNAPVASTLEMLYEDLKKLGLISNQQ